MTQGALTAQQAAAYIGMKDAEWMYSAPIPKCDIRSPGASRPVWRWRVVDLDQFLAERLVKPGHASPFEA